MKCKKCGVENASNSKYCQECGNDLKISKNKSKVRKGDLKLESKTKIRKGDKAYPEKYKTVSFLGFVGLFLFLPLGVICGIYLWTRPESFAKKRGKFIVLFSIGLWLLYIIVLGLFK